MNIFDVLIFRPIFNLLVFIDATIPGSDFGIAIIIFTVLVRMLMWPLVKKQLHQSRVMRKIQPEVKKLRQKYKGNRQQESMALMELYKRHGVNPFSSIGMLIVQLPIFIGLFGALRSIINDPAVLLERSYSFIRDLPYLQDVAANVNNFDSGFLNIVDTTDYAFSDGQIASFAALVIAALAGFFQYLNAKQLQPQDGTKKPRRTFREIIQESREGKEPDMSELNAATARRMTLIMPAIIVVIAAVSPAGLAIYFATSAMVGYIQQRFVLNQDVHEMEEMNIKTTVRTAGDSKKAGSTKKTSPRKKKGKRK